MVSRILGPDGQPIRLATLREPQTARTTQLHQEWQGHPSRGLTPSRLAAILDGAEQGDLIRQSELFDDMEEKDTHLFSEMGKRRRALLSLPWDVVPPPSPWAKEKAAAKELKELLAEIPDFTGLLFDATDAIGKGFANLEIEWHRLDGRWLPKSVTHRPQSWFTLHRGAPSEEIRLRGHSSQGEPLQPFGWIQHRHRATSGWLARSALFRVLVWPYLFKNYSVADLAEFLEIYGIPLRVGRYPAGAGEKEKMTLLRALAGIGHKAAGIIPEGMLIEFHDAATGDPAAYELMIEWCERSQSKAILGGTLTSQTSQSGGGAYALGQIHDDVRKDLRDGDARQLEATLTRDLIYPIAALNGLTDGLRRCPRMHFVTEETDDITAFSTALPPLIKAGFRIPRQWAQERLGIPEPDADDDDVLVPDAGMAAGGWLPGPEPGAPPALAAATAQRVPDDYLATLVDQLAQRAGPHVDGWLDQIRDEVAAATDLDDLLGRLSLLLTDLPLDELATLIGDASGAADRAGRSDVQDESDG